MTVTIARLGTAAEAGAATRLLQEVWRTDSPPVHANLLRAIDHSGGYVYGAYDGGTLVAASVAFLGGAPGDVYLHSHITGTLTRRAGLGKALKLHQRDWCLARGIDRIVWTFDPLVRRNAAFNINGLGALPVEYLVDYYGPMDDGINRGDETDRLRVEWRLAGEPPAVGAEVMHVAVPDDIEALRRTDRDAATAWRRRLRDELGDALAAGWVVVGFGDAGYVLARR